MITDEWVVLQANGIDFTSHLLFQVGQQKDIFLQLLQCEDVKHECFRK